MYLLNTRRSPLDVACTTTDFEIAHAVTVSPLVSFNTVGSISLYSGPILDRDTTLIPVAESRNMTTAVEL